MNTRMAVGALVLVAIVSWSIANWVNADIVLMLTGLGLVGVLTDRHGRKRQAETVLPADDPDAPRTAG